LAVHLFKSGEMTSARAAKLARMGLPQFLAHLSAQGIPVVDHDPAELEQELAAFDAAR
jgi:predicted HTH domain antitoxin